MSATVYAGAGNPAMNEYSPAPMKTGLKQGDVLGDTWRIDVLLGRGGMGEVWEAQHTRVPGKRAAVKTLHAVDSQGQDLLARFRREAEIAARLEHPNIVQLFDSDVLPSGEPYLVMELLRGETLKARLKRGPLSLPELQSLVLQVGSALSVAHHHGVVHRDLKPDNLFLVPTPTGPLAKVLDFGISKLLGSDQISTSNSVLIGTPRYMSPEQALGENDRLTAKSDVFSLASVCYEAFSGAPPFVHGSLVRVVHAIVNEAPVPLTGLPPGVAAAFEAAFQKHAEERCTIEAFVASFCGVELGAGGKVASGVVPAPLPAPREAEQPTRESRAPKAEAPRASPPRPAHAKAVKWLALLSAALVVGGAVLALSRGSAPEQAPVTAPDAGSPGVVLAPVAPVVAPPGAIVESTDSGPPAALATVTVDAGSSVPVAAARVAKAAPVEVITEEQQAALGTVEADFSAGRYAEAVGGSLRPVIAHVGRAVELRTMAYCALGNLGLARATKPQVPRAHLAAVRDFCRQHDIDLD